MVSPYHRAMDGNASSGQRNAQATALRPPAPRPAAVPARIRSVGAPARKAQTRAANGRIARSGIEKRHVSQPLPRMILLQEDKSEDPSATAARTAIAMNGAETNAAKLRASGAGHASLGKKPAAVATTLNVKSSLSNR